MLDEPVRLLGARLTELGRDEEIALLHGVRARLARALSELENAPGASGLIHADLHVGNVLYDQGVGYALIDFDHCAYGWRVYDLIPLLVTLGINVPDASIVDRVEALVLEGYERTRPFSRTEREAIPALRFLWHLWDLGENLVHSSVWGGPIEGDEETRDEFLDRAMRTLEVARSRWLGD